MYPKSGVKPKENETKSIDEQVCGLCNDVAEDHVVLYFSPINNNQLLPKLKYLTI